jgi:hypothetical protein
MVIKATNLCNTGKNIFGKFSNTTGVQPYTPFTFNFVHSQISKPDCFSTCDLLVLDKVTLFSCYKEELGKVLCLPILGGGDSSSE